MAHVYVAGANVGYSAMLMHCAQTMFVTGEEVFPIERTLVATGVNCAGGCRPCLVLLKQHLHGPNTIFAGDGAERDACSQGWGASEPRWVGRGAVPSDG